MREHYIVKCENCDATMSQCRCPAMTKAVSYDLCNPCKTFAQDAEQKEARARYGAEHWSNKYECLAREFDDYRADAKKHYGPYGPVCMTTGQFDAGECWLCYAKRKKQECIDLKEMCFSESVEKNALKTEVGNLKLELGRLQAKQLGLV